MSLCAEEKATLDMRNRRGCPQLPSVDGVSHSENNVLFGFVILEKGKEAAAGLFLSDDAADGDIRTENIFLHSLLKNSLLLKHGNFVSLCRFPGEPDRTHHSPNTFSI